MRDVWRAAHYVGKPVTIPPLPPVVSSAPPKVRISTTAGGMDGRHEFVRGEEVNVRVDGGRFAQGDRHPARTAAERQNIILSNATCGKRIFHSQNRSLCGRRLLAAGDRPARGAGGGYKHGDHRNPVSAAGEFQL